MQSRPQRPTTSNTRKQGRGTSEKRQPSANMNRRPISANTQIHQVQNAMKKTSNTAASTMKPPVNPQKQEKVPSLIKSANRFRIAQPGMRAPDISGRYWNQVSTQIQAPSAQGDFQKYVKDKMKGTQGHQDSRQANRAGAIRATHSQNYLPRDTPVNVGERNLFSEDDELSEIGITEQTYRDAGLHSARDGNQDEELQKPFTFLANLGGKETSSALLTPKVTLGQEQHVIVSHQGLGGKLKQSMRQQTIDATDPHGITIFTNADVDKHQFNVREQRLQSAKTRIGGTRPLSSQRSHKQFNRDSRPVSSYQNMQQQQQLLRDGQASSRAQRDFRIQSGKSARPQSAFQKNKMLGGYNRPISANIQKKGHKFSNRGHGKENRESDMNDSDYDELDIEEVSEEGANFADFEKSVSHKIFNSRPTTATIFKKDTDSELPYPELFDRSERTFAATYAKFGDLSYYTPLQRIGSYMDYSARLKKKHLQDIIQYLKTSKAAMKVEDEEATQDYMESCLFIGVMSEEEKLDEELEFQQQNRQEEEKFYDPSRARFEGETSYEKVWSNTLVKQVQISMHRYNHYLQEGDCIRNEEISKYKKEWMSNALDLLSDSLVKQHSSELRDLFQEVFVNYTDSMKRTILNYILRSPDERKRLHILVLPRPIPPSSDKICLNGGYSTEIYKDWHERKISAEQEIKLRLLTNNVIMSSLTNWFYDFRSINLFQFEGLKSFVSDGYSLDIDSFIQIQEAMREKAHSILVNIWYRGVIMIVKKFKFLKKRGGTPCGKWTYQGYQEMDQNQEKRKNDQNLEEDFSPIKFCTPYSSLDGSLRPSQQYFKSMHPVHDSRGKTFVASQMDEETENEYYWRDGFEFDAMIDDFHVDTQMDELIDVRENSAYIAFVAMIGGYINYDEDGYEILAKEYKTELKYSSGNLIQLQLREIINKSVHRFRKFFESFYTLNQLVNDANQHNEIQMSRQSSFKSDSTVVVQEATPQGKKKVQIQANSNQKSDKRKQPAGKIAKYQTFRAIDRKDPVLKLPEFTKYQHLVTPFLRICLKLENNIIEFEQSSFDITSKLVGQLDRVISSFNSVLHPEFAKLEFISKTKFDEEEEEEKRQKRLLFHTTKKANEYENVIFKGFDKDIYRKYIPTVRIKESQKVSKELTDDGNHVFQKKQIDKSIWIADAQEDCFRVVKSFIQDTIDEHYQECQQVHQLFEQLQPLIRRDLEENIKVFCTEDHKMSEFQDLLMDLRDFQKLVDQLPHTVFFPMFEISLLEVKQILQDRCRKLIFQVFRKFEVGVIERSTGICERYYEIVKKLEMVLKTPEDVLEIDKYKNNLLIEMSSLSDRMYENRKSIFFLIHMDFIMSEETEDLVRQLHHWPSKLNKALDVADDRHRNERATIEEKVMKNKERFEINIGGFEEDIKEILALGDVYKFEQNHEKLQQYFIDIEKYEEEMNTLSNQEMMLFGFKSNYDSFFNLKKFFQPHYDLWVCVYQFMSKRNEWNETRLSNIEADEVEQLVKISAKMIDKLSRRFDDKQLASRVLQSFQREVQDLNSWAPTIAVLCNRGLKDRHWREIMNIAQNEFNYENITLDGIKLYPVREHLNSLQEISDRASKEFALERQMDKMMGEWSELHFELGTFRDTGIIILKGANVEEIQLLLDDHTVKAQLVRGNPFVRPMEQRAIKWEKLLLHIQECLDVWIKVQASYLYLEPIFNSEDIVKKLPSEAAEFFKVNKMWGELMSQLQNDTKVLNLENIPNLFDQLDVANSALDRIQKSLSDYLETKRQFFPRFYFLSNEDLLEILGESKKPLKVQRHLKKCFEGIDQLVFTERTEIVGMISRECEEMSFEQMIHPNEFKGNVEQWLMEVEIGMKQSVKLHIADSVDNYLKMNDRLRWIQSWQGQVVLTVSQIIWTQTISESLQLSDGQLQSLKNYFKLLENQLEEIVNLVRQDLDPLVRLTLGSLIVLDVHAKDVLEDLIEKRVSSLNDFDWLAQMRYYFYPQEKHVDVKMINSTVDMGYEYLGNQSRLVITPLTDRCYRTLMSALHLNLGGAPEGPAGTGKTESTKDLAKAVAVHCMVFNCAEGLNAKAMAKFFKGLASAGSWSCFDEFNRIELEVLSVVAQQILEIQKAKSAQKTQFYFDDAEIVLKQSCNVFITMNPGYAGRSELPDNLKALFRPVAMMIPDYNMIAEISLYSFGFFESRNLAKKIVATYKLCSEQLSRQDHYDYGMRAVKAVLTAAKNLKRKYQNEKEDKLILMAINDVNLPKFLKHDIPLFVGITEDLFQGVTLQAQNYGTLGEQLELSIEKFKLQKIDSFVDKIIQLYEMINCRHGLMLVGPPFGAKTSAYKVLADAITNTALTDENYGELPVKHFVINPKSVTLNQLYGWFDPISHDFTDGILAHIFRNCAYKHVGKNRNWIIFDGPVDANWIENMNTVLDDNKKLCLLNGEVIMMNDNMNLIFETGDLSQASPATVSRCGMVYMQPESIGWQPILKCWIQTLPNVIDSNLIKHIEDLFEVLIPLAYSFLKKKCKTYVHVSEVELTNNLMKIYYCMVAKNQQFLDLCVNPKVKPEDLIIRLDQYFLFSMIWSFGCVADEVGTKHFSQFIRKNLSDNFKIPSRNNKTMKIDKLAQLPESGLQLVHNYFIDDYRWKSWKEVLDKQDRELELDPTLKYNEIVIPTTETLKYTFLLDLFVKNKLPVLLIGPTGTGKTIYVTKYLRSLPFDQYASTFLCFSAKTTANQTQDIIDGKLEKRGRRIYGPSFGKEAIIFVDDLNMPQLEKYGAQPPIELLRQWQDHKGWYDRKEKDRPFKELRDLLWIACMGPPSGGKNPVTPRYLRHFNILSINNFDEQVLNRIFTKLMDWHIKNNGYGQEVARTLSSTVFGSVDIYLAVCQELRPTPAKSHYLFNLRDLSRVIQGIQMLRKEESDDPKKIVRLWVHETCRVFYDRLTNEQDQDWLYERLFKTSRDKVKDDLNIIFKSIVDENVCQIQNKEALKFNIFGDILGDGISCQDRPYDEITSHQTLIEKMTTFLDDYNSISRKPMSLVLFQYAISHVLKNCRILRMPRGNGLLIGVGGSGRQSLTKLSTFICDYDIFEIEISKSYTQETWKDDMRKLLKSAGVDGKPHVFLLSDAQIKFSFILEDINNLLNTGEIPNLFPNDEKAIIIEKLRPISKKEGRLDLFNNGMNEQFLDFFTERVKANLHIVLAMSPIGDFLRTRIRNFPSLVNCCTIDWFTSWPDEALEAVADKYLQEVDLDQDTRNQLIKMCKKVHKSVHDLSSKFLQEEKRYNYVTPTSYLELIQSYKTLLTQQRDLIMSQKLGYERGIEKLLFTAEEVSKMQDDLNDKQPKLIQMTAETDELLKKIQKESDEVVEPKKQQIQAEEAIANTQAQEAQSIKIECDSDLAKAMPLVKKAIEALNTIQAKDINEMKALGKPPAPIRKVMHAVCVMCQRKVEKTPKKENPKEFEENWWLTSQKFMAEKDFMTQIIKYDKDNIPDSVVNKIRQSFIPDPDFKPNRVQQASMAAKGLCLWVRALDEYDKVAKIVAPKRASAKEAEAKYQSTMASLREKQDELREVVEVFEQLQQQLEHAQMRKQRLNDDIEDCKKKLIRAQQLLGGLGGEKERWEENTVQLEKKYSNLVGDTLLCSSIISYLGAFTNSYRQQALKFWMFNLNLSNVNVSPAFSLQQCLGQPVSIRQWTLNGLPNDQFSIENGIIVFNSNRWPLMIDPQSQANKWTKNNELQSGHKLSVVKLNDSDFIRVMETSIQLGMPVLIENVGEEIDPTLEPVLLKQTFKNAGIISIKLGENIIEYNEGFRLYLTTKYRNPHYLPELSTKVTLLNFMITFDGLRDQLLNLVVQKENAALDDLRQKLIVQSYENKKQLKEIEDKILEVLRNSKGNILDDEQAIDVLNQSQTLSKDIKEKQQQAEETEVKLEEAQRSYDPISYHSALLFFIIQNLGNLDVMYQYSLTWFINLFSSAIDHSEKSDVIEERIDYIKNYFTESLYMNVCRSLFEQHKLIFSFILTSKLLEANKELEPEFYQYLISTQDGIDNPLELPNPCENWLTNSLWNKLCDLAKVLPRYSAVPNTFKANEKIWKNFYESAFPHQTDLPDQFWDFSEFEKLLIIKILRPDKLVPAVKDFIIIKMGDQFVNPPPFDLELSYSDSSYQTPLIFVLPGADPQQALNIFAKHKKKFESLKTISLGQGQGVLAEKAIEEAKKSGGWVLLQNCHLYPSWMNKLEKIQEGLEMKQSKDPIHPSFRLWLTSYPSESFPILLLQNGIKMTNEPPKGLRANMLGSFTSYPISKKDFLSEHSNPHSLTRLLYGLCMFHAIIQERRTFGPLGWNILYEFNMSDLQVSVMQLYQFTNEYQDTPYNALNYLTGECNYGGRVTDDRDRRVLMSLLKDFYTQEVFDDQFSPAQLKEYRFPPSGWEIEKYVDFIHKLPQEEPPQLFGFHPNANITKDINETDQLIVSMIKIGEIEGLRKDKQQDQFQTQTEQVSQVKDKNEQLIENLAKDILRKQVSNFLIFFFRLPRKFDIEAALEKYPVVRENSMNTVLVQEMQRFNNLTKVIRKTLRNLQLGLKGDILMSEELENVYQSLLIGEIPEIWKKVSYPSLKSAASYIKDLMLRLQTLQQWFNEGPPNIYWLSGFFFTQSFLTAAMQNYARKHKIEIDTLTFEFDYMQEDPTDYTNEIYNNEKITHLAAPDDGVLVSGLYIEGAKWDYDKNQLGESDNKILFTKVPIIWFKPTQIKKATSYSYYDCPLYKTVERRGILSTTGHSTNFILMVKIPSDIQEENWAKRGVAMICQLSQ